MLKLWRLTIWMSRIWISPETTEQSKMLTTTTSSTSDPKLPRNALNLRSLLTLALCHCLRLSLSRTISRWLLERLAKSATHSMVNVTRISLVGRTAALSLSLLTQIVETKIKFQDAWIWVLLIQVWAFPWLGGRWQPDALMQTSTWLERDPPIFTFQWWQLLPLCLLWHFSENQRLIQVIEIIEN